MTSQSLLQAAWRQEIDLLTQPFLRMEPQEAEEVPWKGVREEGEGVRLLRGWGTDSAISKTAHDSSVASREMM